MGSDVFTGIHTYYGDTSWTFSSIGGSQTFGEFWDGRMDDVFVIGGAASELQMAQIKANPDNLATIAAQVVPEPSTWAFLAFSLTTVVVRRRRDSKS